MKPTLITAFLLIISLVFTHAQQRPATAPDSAFFRPLTVPSHLKPIERGPGSLGVLGNVYFYGGKRLSSVNSLEIPFYELNDPTVLRHFRQYRLLGGIGRGLALVPLIYLLSQTQNRSRFNSGSYWTIYFGSIGASLGLGLVANGQANKAVAVYNRRLAGVPSLGFSVVPTLPQQPVAVGPVVSWRF
jgi:hypothetical protein